MLSFGITDGGFLRLAQALSLTQPTWQDIRDAIEYVGWTFLDDFDFADLHPEDFEQVNIEMMTVEDLAYYAGLDLSSGLMMTEKGAALLYGDPREYLEEAASGTDRDFSNALAQRAAGGLSPVIVIEENGEHYFGDGWGRVNVAYALDEPLAVATYRRINPDQQGKDGRTRLAQVLKYAPPPEHSTIEIFWDEDQDNPESGGWVWHFIGAPGIVHPLQSREGKDPTADDGDLEFAATMDPEFPGGDVQFVVDRDNTPIFG